MVADDGTKLSEKSDFVNNGDIGFTLQINLGIPF
jgi:hypothetical protein